MSIAETAGIDPDRFLEMYRNGKAEHAFMQDLYYVHSLGIRALPSYLVRRTEQSCLMHGLPSSADFEKVIEKMQGLFSESNPF